ncbi:MAG: NAD(P)H-dependent glycerol-3-phosphate dehydrogenase [Desulfuromonadales bacterium]
MNIGVIGAGSWGTTLANLLAKKNHSVTLWAYEADLVKRMNETRENDLFLPGFNLAQNLEFTNDPREAVAGRKLLLLACPSQIMRTVVEGIVDMVEPGTQIVSAAKGIENDSLMTMSEVLEDIFPHETSLKTAFLSGPSFAREVAAELPTAVAVASRDPESAELVQDVFSTEYFRVYTNLDVVGVELGGALKNVMALAAGVSDGLGFGFNARAGLITRGLAEMIRIGEAQGASASTFSGLAGMGDLVLTCTGDLSRNRSVGMELGRGKKLKEILEGMNMVAEGVKTTLSASQMARRLDVEVPIIAQMHAILYEDKNPRQAVTDLMSRELKAEV